MRNQRYGLPERFGKTSYWWYYTPDWDLYLLNQGWLIVSHTMFSKSQFLMMISPISSHLSLSHPHLYHYLGIGSFVIPLYLFMPWSRVNTENSRHWVLHTLSTAYNAYCIIPRSTDFLLPASLLITWETMFYRILYIPHNYALTNGLSLGSRCAPLLNYPFQIGWLHVLLHSRSIMSSKCISRLAQSQHPSVHPIWPDYWLHNCTITASMTISKITQSQSPSVSSNSLVYSLQIHTIRAFKYIADLARSQPPNVSLYSLNYSFSLRTITACKCICTVWRSQPPSLSPKSLIHGVQICTIPVSKFARSLPRSASFSSLDYGVVKQWRWKADNSSAIVHLTSHGIRRGFLRPSGFASRSIRTERDDMMEYLAMMNNTKWVDLWILGECTWDQEWGKIDCVFRFMQWFQSTPGCSKYLLLVAESISAIPVSLQCTYWYRETCIIHAILWYRGTSNYQRRIW